MLRTSSSTGDDDVDEVTVHVTGSGSRIRIFETAGPIWRSFLNISSIGRMYKRMFGTCKAIHLTVDDLTCALCKYA
jgi:hypothetical protein